MPGQPAESTGKTARDEAEAILATRLRERAAGIEYDPAARKLTIDDLVKSLLDEYASKPAMKKRTEARWKAHLQPFFGGMKASALGTEAMRKYRAERVAKKASQTTVNRELQILRRAYRLAAESDPPRVQRVPRFKFPSENNARRVFVDLPTQEKLLKAASAEGLWCRCFVEMAFSYGWRRGELLGLTVGDVDFLRGVVALPTSKNGEPREAPMTPALRTLLEALAAGKNGKPRKASDRLFPVYDIRYAWKRICAAAGVTAGRGGIILHDIRRSSARTKRSAGVPTSVIMELQGWKSEAMFRRYAITDNADKLAALEAEQRWAKTQSASDQLQNARKEKKQAAN